MNQNDYGNNGCQQTGFSNNYNYSQNQYNQSGYTNPNEYMDFQNGFEAGNPVVNTLQDFKAVVCEEVIAKSFLFMIVALLITAFATFTTNYDVALRMLTGSNYYILIFAELGIVLVSNWALSKNIPVLAGVLFVIYSYLTGMVLAPIFLIYTASSITSIFLITAALFGIMSIYGLVTKKDLSSVGSLCLMGLIGIILVSIVNLLILRSSVFDTIICGIGVFIFIGLTAYDTQKIKSLVAVSDDRTVLSLALYGAFELYLDFVNLFLKLLRILGKRK